VHRVTHRGGSRRRERTPVSLPAPRQGKGALSMSERRRRSCRSGNGNRREAHELQGPSLRPAGPRGWAEGSGFSWTGSLTRPEGSSPSRFAMLAIETTWLTGTGSYGLGPLGFHEARPELAERRQHGAVERGDDAGLGIGLDHAVPFGPGLWRQPVWRIQGALSLGALDRASRGGLLGTCLAAAAARSVSAGAPWRRKTPILTVQKIHPGAGRGPGRGRVFGPPRSQRRNRGWRAGCRRAASRRRTQ
jgi:hypothetical protein